jgi:small-conductance mechanosensitive channel
MSNYDEKIARINDLTTMLKSAFQPMPAMPAPGGAPPQDPNAAAAAGAPMDPAMAGAAPAPQDPAQLEAMLSEVMSAIEQMAGAMEQQGQLVGQLQQQLQQVQQEHMQMGAQMQMLEKALKDSTSPLEGVPAEAM